VKLKLTHYAVSKMEFHPAELERNSSFRFQEFYSSFSWATDVV